MTNKALNILLTDGDYKHTLGIARSLGKNHSLYVLAFHKYSLASFSRYCKGEIVIKDYSDDNFLNDLLEAIKKYGIEIVIPVGSRSVKIFSDHRDIVHQHAKLLLPSPGSLEIALSKIKSTELAQKLDIPSPVTIKIDTIEDMENYNSKILYPCVVKAPEEMGNNLVDYVYSSRDLKFKFLKLSKRYRSEGNLPIIQEYIEGVGCGFFALYLNGKCGPVFMHKRLREFPPGGGFSTAAISIDNKLIEEYGRRILDSLEWNGIAMVEFKLSQNGIPYFLEINPKFWGSTELAISSGVDFPSEMVDAIMNNQISYSKNYKLDFRYHWPFNGDISHGLLRISNLPSVVKDCFDRKTRSNILLLKDTKASFMIIIYGIFQRMVYILKYIVHGKR